MKEDQQVTRVAAHQVSAVASPALRTLCFRKTGDWMLGPSVRGGDITHLRKVTIGIFSVFGPR